MQANSNQSLYFVRCRVHVDLMGNWEDKYHSCSNLHEVAEIISSNFVIDFVVTRQLLKQEQEQLEKILNKKEK